MPLPVISAISVSNLKSKVINNAILQQTFGGTIKKLSVNGSSGILGGIGRTVSEGGNFLWDALLKVGNWLFRAGQFGFTTLAQWVMGGYRYIWNFNWNMTDEQIDQQIQSLQVQIASIAGGLVGQGLGYAVCGGVAGAAIAVFNPALAKTLLLEVGQEALEELSGNLYALVQATTRAAVQAGWLRLFQAGRPFFNLYSNAVGSVLDTIVPGSQGWADYRDQRTANGQHISFADFVEEKVESLDNPVTTAFWEEVFDEFGDGCEEAIMVIANGLDNFRAQQKIASQAMGPEKIVTLTPNRKLESEIVFMGGPMKALKPAITQTMANYQLLENRDVGQFVGSNVEEFIRATPMKLRVNLILFPYSEPPFWRGNDVRPQMVTLTIPDFDRTKLDWITLKNACGGSGGYTWGRFMGSARLDNGRTLRVYGASEQICENQIDRMLPLTDANLISLTVTDTLIRGVNQNIPGQRRQPRQVYPGYVYILNRQEFIQSTGVRHPVKGNFRDKSMRLPLWVDTKPANWEETVNEILLFGQMIGTQSN